ncbi:hypothetical protein V8G54_003105 [Vigna mungo]|uniref:Uncharacterized protein n=1 Tax=Vigna mungo TaxID=3915 RepID=A0AAQ3PB64_VIGMU
MADYSGGSETHEVVVNVTKDTPKTVERSDSFVSVPFLQKVAHPSLAFLIAEVVGTYFLIFAGCGSIVVNNNHYNVVPAYVAAQLLGGTLASGTLKLLFMGKHDQFSGTLPTGTDLQAFVLEFIITFFLMFVISGVATDNRAIGELAGIAIGSTILLNVMIAGPVTGASMNPVRSLGPAFMHAEYKGIWIFILAPILGAVAGAWVYNIIRYTDKPLREITKSASFLKGRTAATK